MMKTLKNLMLVGLLAISCAMNAQQPPLTADQVATIAKAAAEGAAAGNAGNAGNSSSDAFSVKNIAFTAALGLGAWLSKDIYDWCKGEITGEASKKSAKESAEATARELGNMNTLAEATTRELNHINTLMDIENKKIALAFSESDAQSKEYQTLILLYNGGNNTGLDKKDIQDDIKELRKAMKANKIRTSEAINAANAKIKELEGRLKELASKPQTLAQATQLPIATRPMTPALAATLAPARAA